MAYEIVKSAEFCGIECDFYSNENNDVFMTSFQLGSCLGYSNPQKAVDNLISRNEYLKNIEFSVTLKMRAADGKQYDTRLFTEDGIYEVTMLAKTEKAKDFRAFVRNVVKSIHRHGAYMTPETLEKALYNPDFLIRLATELKDTQNHVRHLEAKIDNDKPKVIFADAVSVSKSSILVGDLAKILKQNGVEIGANRLFAWLRENGYLISRKGSDYNSPTQKSMELKLFEVKETVVTHSDGHTSVNKTPKVTGKGQQYFVNKFLSA